MDKIGSSIAQLTGMINLKASSLQPPVFPQYLAVRDVLDLTSSESQRKHIEEWLAAKDLTPSHLGMSTIIDYPGRKVVINAIKVQRQTHIAPGSFVCITDY